MTARSESLRLWRRVAQGDLSRSPDQYDRDDLQGWLQQVAARLLEADGEPASQRAGAVVRAVGLAGKVDGYADLRALIAEPQWMFGWAREDGEYVDATQAQTVVAIVDEAIKRGILTGDYVFNRKAATDLVRGLWLEQL